MKIPVISILACVALGTALGILTGGGFIHAVLSMLLGGYIGFPLLVVVLISIGVAIKRHSGSGFLSGASLFLVCYLTLIGAFYLGGKGIFEYRERAVKEFVISTLPMLEAHKAKRGAYPESLQEVGIRDQPYYFRGRHGYTSDGKSFTFYYEDPNAIMGGMMFTNQHRQWQLAD
jgi:hypothetical protein